MRNFVALLALAACTRASAPAAAPSTVALPPGTTHAERTQRYRVQGETALEVRRDMVQRGPMEGRRHFDARTDWNVRWSYRDGAHAGACRAENVRVAASVTTILPEWTPPDSAGALGRAWDAYVDALVLHEAGHRDNALAAAAAVAEALRAVETPTCGTLGTEANARANAVLARYRQRDLDYDRDTRHGATQGAVWPPR